MDEATFKNRVVRLFEIELLKGVTDDHERKFIRVETISYLSKLVYEGKLKDAIETGKSKAMARKRKEITILEAQISKQQDRLKKIKTELAVELSSKLCDEDNFLFTQVSYECIETAESSQTPNSENIIAKKNIDDIEVKSFE